MRILNVIGYIAYLLYENVDPCTEMMRTDDYRGRYRRNWYEIKKFTRHS